MRKPLVPMTVDLKDFAFMPVDVQRLLTSETWVLGSGDERAAAMTLWLVSWHQVPASSLPNNDRMLAHLSQAKNWPKIKEHAMRGWELADDGRFYHPIVSEKALEAWLEKLAQRLSSGAGNAKRWGVDFDPEPIERDMAEARSMLASLNPQSRTLAKKRTSGIPTGKKNTPNGNPGGMPSRSQGTGTGTGIYKISKSEREAGARTPEDSQLPDGVDPERWASFRDQLADDGKLSISRIKTGMLQLHRVIQRGHDPNAVLTAAVMRGLRDLEDTAARLARERDGPPPRSPVAKGAGPPHANGSSKTLDAIQTLQGLKIDETVHPRLAQERDPRRLEQAHDVES